MKSPLPLTLLTDGWWLTATIVSLYPTNAQKDCLKQTAPKETHLINELNYLKKPPLGGGIDEATHLNR